MSKPLSDEEKEKVFENIVKSISHIHIPSPGEFTVEMMEEALGGNAISRYKIRHRLNRLVDAEVLGKREISSGGARTNVYFPVRDVAYEELVEILLES